MKFTIASKGALLRLALMVLLLALAVVYQVVMPGTSFSGNPPPTAAETALASELRGHVETLATGICVRNVGYAPAKLSAAADYIVSELTRYGYRVERLPYPCLGMSVENIVAELRGVRTPDEIVVIGAHYDSCGQTCPAANDNGSGVAAVLALARAFAGKPQAKTIRFVAFANEEPPFFRSALMGSRVYAKNCRARNEQISAMLSLETMGFFTDAPDSQHYPPPFSWFYPATGNFIAFVGNCGSRSLVRQCVRSFRAHAAIASEGAAIPGFIEGVGWSDHESFWQNGYRALMVTDTAPFRYPHYHNDSDTPDRLDYRRFARVTAALDPVIRELAK